MVAGNNAGQRHLLHGLDPIHDRGVSAVVSSRQCRRIPAGRHAVTIAVQAVGLAPARHRLAELCITVHRHDPVQLQHVRRHASVAQLASARRADLGTQYDRLHPLPGARIPRLHQNLSRVLGLEAQEYFLVGCIYQPTGLCGLHDLGTASHGLTMYSQY